jgi:hypothetical protein
MLEKGIAKTLFILMGDLTNVGIVLPFFIKMMICFNGFFKFINII